MRHFYWNKYCNTSKVFVTKNDRPKNKWARLKIICLKGLEIQQNVMWLFCDNTYFLLLSLFSSHLFRKSSSRCYIFHLSSPHQVAFLKRTIKKYGKTDWICNIFILSYDWYFCYDFYDPTTLLRFLAAAYHKNQNICYYSQSADAS